MTGVVPFCKLKHGAILYNEAEVFSLSITNPNRRPMLPFDWLIQSSLSLARCHKILFSRFLRLRNNLKTKIRKKRYKQTAKVIYFIYGNMVLFNQLSKRDSVREILATVVVLLLKFSRPFTHGIGCFMAFSLESSISFLMSIFRRNLTVLFFKFCCFFVVLVVLNFFARI